ncbi:SDR family oxidoreductase [Parasphingorhabdus sp.]|jgi:nucleoside-diphosphate-sugar epimerase|uniref:SDR family oxidoreductase n=1 Tax=Parasphingorhabdus sp. TaxID=2709688 RepID=UPI0032EF5A15
MSPPIYVTGAKGYAGTYLTRALIAQGHTVHRLRLFDKGKLVVLQHSDVELDRQAVVIHLSEDSNAGSGIVYDEIRQIALENAKILSGSVQKLIYFSSVAVYDVSASSRHDETSNYLSQDPYAQHKLQIEGGLDLTKDLIVRPSNLYCETVKADTILGDLVSSKYLSGEPTLRNPNIECDFIHMKFVSQFIDRAVRHDWHGIYNVSSGLFTSGHALISAISNSMTLSCKPTPSPYDNRKFMDRMGRTQIPSIVDHILGGHELCLA